MKPTLHLAFVAVVAVVAVLAGAGLAGCASPVIRISSKTPLETPAPIERLLVIADISSNGIDEQMYDGFTKRWTSRLQACGVQSNIVDNDVMNIDVDTDTQKAVAKLNPGATMSIAFAEGALIEQGGARTLIFDLKIVDVATDRVTWMARSTFDLSDGFSTATDREQFGGLFASSIIFRLRHDGVLPGCPSEDPGWPNRTFPPISAAAARGF